MIKKFLLIAIFVMWCGNVTLAFAQEESQPPINAPGDTSISVFPTPQSGVGTPSRNAFLQPEAPLSDTAPLPSPPSQTCGPEGAGYRLCVALPGFSGTLVEEGSLVGYVRMIYQFALGIAGLLVFIMVVWGGIQYALSAGNSAVASDARDRIFQAVIGLALLLLSYVILNTINPALVSLREPGGETVFFQAPSITGTLSTPSDLPIVQNAIANNPEVTALREQLSQEGDPERQNDLQNQLFDKQLALLQDYQQSFASQIQKNNERIKELEAKSNAVGNFFGGPLGFGLSSKEQSELNVIRKAQLLNQKSLNDINDQIETFKKR